jgi:hypothetical protein
MAWQEVSAENGRAGNNKAGPLARPRQVQLQLGNSAG